MEAGNRSGVRNCSPAEWTSSKNGWRLKRSISILNAAVGIKTTKKERKDFFSLLFFLCVYQRVGGKKSTQELKNNRCEASGVIPSGAIFPGVDLGRSSRYSNENFEG